MVQLEPGRYGADEVLICNAVRAGLAPLVVDNQTVPVAVEAARNDPAGRAFEEVTFRAAGDNKIYRR